MAAQAAVVYSILYSAISVLAIGGNGLVIFLIVAYHRMRTVTNLFILNMALGDLLTAVLCIPFSITTNLIQRRWPFGLLMCRLVSYAQAVSVFISAYTLVALSVDRYTAILNPFRVPMTKRQALYLIAFVWLVALLTPLPTAFLSQLMVSNSSLRLQPSDANGTKPSPPPNQHQPEPEPTEEPEELVCTEDLDPEYKSYYSLLLMVLQYVLPFTVLVYTYSRIALVIWGKQTPGEADCIRDARIAASKRKMVKMMITCVAAFTLCWLPFNALIVIGDRFPDIYNQPYSEYVWVACHWLAMSHASYNPIIYMWMSARFCYGFRHVLGHLCPCCRRPGAPLCATVGGATTATAGRTRPLLPARSSGLNGAPGPGKLPKSGSCCLTSRDAPHQHQHQHRHSTASWV